MSATADAEVRRATLIGLFAPVCWGMSVSLVRGIAEGFGMAMGQFLLYVVATVCVFLMVGLPDLRKMDKRYLFIGIPTANLSSLSFCLAIFTSTGGAQTMEVGMVNYLWPALTILFAVVFNGVRTRWWLFPGIALAFAGIVVILSGGSGFSLAGFASRFLENPLSYLLGLSAAVTWSAYSSMTKAWGGLSNPCRRRSLRRLDPRHDEGQHDDSRGRLVLHARPFLHLRHVLDPRRARFKLLVGRGARRCRLAPLLGCHRPRRAGAAKEKSRRLTSGRLGPASLSRTASRCFEQAWPLSAEPAPDRASQRPSAACRRAPRRAWPF